MCASQLLLWGGNEKQHRLGKVNSPFACDHGVGVTVHYGVGVSVTVHYGVLCRWMPSGLFPTVLWEFSYHQVEMSLSSLVQVLVPP